MDMQKVVNGHSPDLSTSTKNVKNGHAFDLNTENVKNAEVRILKVGLLCCLDLYLSCQAD